MTKQVKIVAFPGDGIGPDVVSEGLRILKTVAETFQFSFEFEEGIVGGGAIDKFGDPLPEASLELARNSDAIILGSVGGPKWNTVEYEIRPERALLDLRKELDLYANLRPAKTFPALIDASSLKMEVVENTDILIVRELVGGIYFGEPRGIKTLEDGSEVGTNTLIYTTSEIKRIAKMAFEIAATRKKRVHSVDKANVLESMQLWRRIVSEVGKDYPDIELIDMYVDNCAMQLIKDPKQFDVILTTNVFGDILSDEAAMLTGSIGMLPSASIGNANSMYEPVHGSAPDIAGKDMANPIATILSVAMMFKYTFNMEEASNIIENAVKNTLQSGYRTVDIMEKGSKHIQVGTEEMGTQILKNIAVTK